MPTSVRFSFFLPPSLALLYLCSPIAGRTDGRAQSQLCILALLPLPPPSAVRSVQDHSDTTLPFRAQGPACLLAQPANHASIETLFSFRPLFPYFTEPDVEKRSYPYLELPLPCAACGGGPRGRATPRTNCAAWDGQPASQAFLVGLGGLGRRGDESAAKRTAHHFFSFSCGISESGGGGGTSEHRGPRRRQGPL